MDRENNICEYFTDLINIYEKNKLFSKVSHQEIDTIENKKDLKNKKVNANLAKFKVKIFLLLKMLSEPFFIAIGSRKNIETNLIEIYYFQISLKLVKFLFGDEDEYIFSVLKNGLTKIFTCKNYFQYLELMLKAKLGRFKKYSEAFDVFLFSEKKCFKAKAKMTGNFLIDNHQYEDFLLIFFYEIEFENKESNYFQLFEKDNRLLSEYKSEITNNMIEKEKILANLENFCIDFYPNSFGHYYKSEKNFCNFKEII